MYVHPRNITAAGNKSVILRTKLMSHHVHIMIHRLGIAGTRCCSCCWGLIGLCLLRRDLCIVGLMVRFGRHLHVVWLGVILGRPMGVEGLGVRLETKLKLVQDLLSIFNLHIALLLRSLICHRFSATCKAKR